MLSTIALVFATVLLASGLAAISAGLAAPGTGNGGSPRDQPAAVMASRDGLAVAARATTGDGGLPPTRPVRREGESGWDSLPTASRTGPWSSPLYPQNGVTLWDRIRVSSHDDPQAYLLGTAIQIHAGAAGASPISSP